MEGVPVGRTGELLSGFGLSPDSALKVEHDKTDAFEFPFSTQQSWEFVC